MFEQARDENNLGSLEMSSPNFSGRKKRGRPSKPVDPKSLGGRIRAERLKHGLTTTQLAERIGVKNPTITDTEAGKTNPTDRTLILLARELGSDFGLPRLSNHIKQRFRGGITEIRFIGSTAAGKLTESIPTDEKIEVPLWMLPANKDCFALWVKGDSMRDGGVHHGDVVIVSPTTEPRNKQLVVVDAEHGATIKRWSRKGKTITLMPENVDYDPIEIPINEVRIVHEVVGVLRAVK